MPASCQACGAKCERHQLFQVVGHDDLLRRVCEDCLADIAPDPAPADWDDDDY